MKNLYKNTTLLIKYLNPIDIFAYCKKNKSKIYFYDYTSKMV
jgi:hypothetical protein